MRRRALILGALALAGCAQGGAATRGGGPYRIRPGDAGRVQFAMLDGVNALREARGAPPVRLNAPLNAAAATHARDMAAQNRPWHFGSDGSSPIDRARRAGFVGEVVGETISESFEGEAETLVAWMAEDGPREVILDPRASEMGLGWFQEPDGKLWWAMVLGGPPRARAQPPLAPAGGALPAAGGVSTAVIAPPTF